MTVILMGLLTLIECLQSEDQITRFTPEPEKLPLSHGDLASFDLASSLICLPRTVYPFATSATRMKVKLNLQ
jgi:hypothetical protein